MMDESQRVEFDSIRAGQLPGSELVLGLVGAVGADLSQITAYIVEYLEAYGYSGTMIRVSELIQQVVNVPDLGSATEYDRISNMMTAGDEARTNTGDNAILALAAAGRIYGGRATEGNKVEPRPRQAFVINSLKHPDEVNVLRRIYGNGFFLVGVYVSEEKRRTNLIQKKGMTEEQANSLMRRDEEEAFQEGQRTRATFHLSDFFIHLGGENATRNALQRVIEILFANPYRTPVFDEYAMFMAFAAATRSADLSRQIGAVVARDEDVLATGVNECPRAGGGTYWPTMNELGEVVDLADGRDYKRGFDSNDFEKSEMVEGTLKIIRKVWEGVGKGSEMPDEQMLRSALRQGPIDAITEYGRVVHAEMNALLTCARNKIGCNGATLYTTTFPCHNCAKHIIAAGISRVVYIEPYPKSKALEFHNDSAFAGFWMKASTDAKVAFEPFMGVGPRRFFDLFSMKLGSGFPLRRKNTETGKILSWEPEDGSIRMPMLPWNYLQREEFAVNILKPHLRGGNDVQ